MKGEFCLLNFLIPKIMVGGDPFWLPDEIGFVKAVVIDADGQYAETLFRLR